MVEQIPGFSQRTFVMEFAGLPLRKSISETLFDQMNETNYNGLFQKLLAKSQGLLVLSSLVKTCQFSILNSER